MRANMKICLAASAGGHLSQVLRLVDSWNGTEITAIETTEDPNCYWLTFGGECDFDTLNVSGYVSTEMVDDILAEVKNITE